MPFFAIQYSGLQKMASFLLTGMFGAPPRRAAIIIDIFLLLKNVLFTLIFTTVSSLVDISQNLL